MTKPETQSLDNLDLSWPHCVNYHADISGSELSSPCPEREAESTDTGSHKPGTKYNGVPREVLGDAETLLGSEIRVLRLKKGTREMPLEGSLRKVHLSDQHVYEPLSYTWEDYDTVQPSDDETEDDFHPALFLSGTKHYLDLTSNCAKALYSVRKPTTDRTIWVDSICVNQDDPEERSHQVNLMKEIYARAFTVLVYLGQASTDDDSSSDIAMSLLGQPDRLQVFGQLEAREATSLKRLFERPYFRRMWIVQEVGLAKTIEFHCGSATAYVSKFAGKPLEAILGSRVTPPWLRHSKQTVIDIPKDHAASQARQILGLIFDTALCDCKDDRDRIFALLSLLNPSDKEQLSVDYSLSTAQVYTGIAAYLAKNGFLWGILMLAPRLATNSCPSLPSWVPQWNNLHRAGLESTHILESHTLGLDTMIGVTGSGSITMRGMLLGSVTYSGHSSDFIHGPFDMGMEQRLAGVRFSREDYPEDSVWRLAKRPQAKSLDSWQCHFHFLTPGKYPRNVVHRAFMLPDYSTVLILRPHQRLRGQYTLIEVGMSLVWATLPVDGELGRQTRRTISLHPLKPTSRWTQTHWDTVLSSKDVFPRLSGFTELWRHNPLTLSTTLTLTAIQQIQSTDMRELDLLKRWQKHVRIGIQVLRDEVQLRNLIDRVNGLRQEDYMQLEKAAGLGDSWSLGHFLGLFIRDPFNKEPIEWPDVQLLGDQPLQQTAVLPQLMEWAQVTQRFLLLLSKEDTTYAAYRWPKLLMDPTLHSVAMAVAKSQVSIGSANGTIDISCGRDRTSVLLEQILNQLSEEAGQIEGPYFIKGQYWDWGRFISVMEQRFSVLSHIQPDVEKIQSDLGDFKDVSGFLTTFEVFAAHGVDMREAEFTKIQIR